LDKQSQEAERGGPPTWGLGEGLTIPHRKKKKASYEMLQRASELNSC